MLIDENYYIKEILKGRRSKSYWSASNKRLAQYVFREIKEQIPEAKYYEYDGLQFVTVNHKQKKALLRMLETLEDLYNKKLGEINGLMQQIAGEVEDV